MITRNVNIRNMTNILGNLQPPNTGIVKNYE